MSKEFSNKLFDKPAYKNLLLEFLNDFPKYQNRLEEAISNEKAFKKVAHEIKGAFSIYGFQNIANVGNEIQTLDNLSLKRRLEFHNKLKSQLVETIHLYENNK
jgi:HPt (histidine-containing phosphotransfer) domain-containing protein